MIRRRSALAGFRSHSSEEEPNPMESVANMTDVMLVLAVALMLAIAARWNVNVTEAVQLDPSSLEPIDAQISEEAAQASGGDARYEEVGTVYRDIDTGELYVVG